MVYVNNITDNIHKYNNVYEISFILQNIHTGLANSLRRIILTEIPNVSFDDTNINEHHASITIHKNTSALHNEFLAHRLSLIPICTIHNPILRIKTYWDNINQVRKYAFSNQEKIPIFVLKQSNADASTTGMFGNTQIKEVFSNDFTFLTPTEYSMDDFFPRDIITDDYILINKLKPSFNESIGEEIHATCKLTIGNGKENTRYCPVGTVTYSFEQDSPDQIELNFNHYVEYLQKERKEKNIDIYSEDELVDIKKSYTHLDAYRVFKKDKQGNANSILFNVETIGGMNPYTIVYDAFHMMSLKLQDILKSILYVHHNDTTKLNMTSKIEIKKVNTNIYDIYLNNEDHTIGNLLAFYMKYLYTDGIGIIAPIFKIASYKMPHPLEPKIVFRMQILDTIDLLHCLNLTHVTNSIRTKSGENVPFVSTSSLDNVDNLDKWVIIELFQLTIMYVLDLLDKLKVEWREKTPVTDTSFDIIDVPFVQKNISIHTIHDHLTHIHDNSYSPPPVLPLVEQDHGYDQSSPVYQPSPVEGQSPAYQPASPVYGPASPV
jgi:DNA-directed RNA polymerase subunit L